MNRAKLLSLITNKWPVKVLSLAAAIIISVFYRLNTLETRFFTVPLLVESSEILVPSAVFETSARVSIRGEAEDVQLILEEDIEAYIDLGRYLSEGSYRVPVQIRKKGSALGVEPLEISVKPVEIPIVLENRITRNIPVFPVFSGTVAEGYELTYQTIIPGSVIVEGPRSAMENHIEFNTETINLDRRYEDFSIIVNIINNYPLFTILGSRIFEFRGSISRIAREEHAQVITAAVIPVSIEDHENTEDDEHEEEIEEIPHTAAAHDPEEEGFE